MDGRVTAFGHNSSKAPTTRIVAGLLLLLAAGIAAVGCGSSTTGAPTTQSSAAPPNSASTVPTTTTTTVPSGANMAFSYTSPAGWTYKGGFPLDSATLSGQSENSPVSPTDAMLNLTQALDGGQPTTQRTIADSNPGNTSGPLLQLNLEAVVWSSATAASAFQSYLGDVQRLQLTARSEPQVGPSCTTLTSSYDNPTEEQTINTSWLPSGLIYCSTVPITLATFSNPGVPTANVQSALAGVGSLTPSFVYGFSAGSDSCEISITSSGQVTLDPGSTTGTCGTLQVTKE